MFWDICIVLGQTDSSPVGVGAWAFMAPGGQPGGDMVAGLGSRSRWEPGARSRWEPDVWSVASPDTHLLLLLGDVCL